MSSSLKGCAVARKAKKRRVAAQQESSDARHAKKLTQLRNRLLRTLRKGIRGIRRPDQITHENVHLIHNRLQIIHEQIQDLRSHCGEDAIVDCTGIDLQKANLVGAAFFRINLEGANLAGSFGGSFPHTNLKHANLSGAQTPDLGYADLTGANLQNADLQEGCLLGAVLDGADLTGANLCGAELINIQANGAVWDGATFDAKTRFSPDFDLPSELRWVGTGTDPRTKKKRGSKKSVIKKKSRSRKPTATAATPTLKCLLSDTKLKKLCSDLESDPALPDGVSTEHMSHPLYGPDFAYSIALEYCPNRFRDLGLTSEEFAFNVWYRAERFVRLYDAVEDCFSDGDHDRAEGLMPNMSGDLGMKAHRRMQREVRKILSNK